MPFLHSLVKIRSGEQVGWYTPLELGEASPHYVSYAIPVDAGRDFFEEYHCEMIDSTGGQRRVELASLTRRSPDSFALQIGGVEFWFALRAGRDWKRQWPYVGALKHEDFLLPLVEIEPENPGELDDLYDKKGLFVIGCEPFTHYENIGRVA